MDDVKPDYAKIAKDLKALELPYLKMKIEEEVDNRYKEMVKALIRTRWDMDALEAYEDLINERAKNHSLGWLRAMYHYR